MSKTAKNVFMFIIAAMLVFCVAVLPSNAKYVHESNAPYGDKNAIDFTLYNQYEVKTQDELFAAINSGYDYIQISKEVENPLIVTQKEAADLESDLILDLNGIEIQRNGPEPILNVKAGIKLTIIDTSDEQTGGLYNPVGSVFNIEGGTLSVATGTFECGPRYSEYYSYNSEVLDNSENSTTKRTLVEDKAQLVKYYGQGENVSESLYAPIIKSYPTKTGDIEYTHGNLYFDKKIDTSVSSGSQITISADTYCYYHTNEKAMSAVTDPATANWRYSYYVTQNKYEYVGADLSSVENSENFNKEDYVLITVYGYEKTIASACDISSQKDYYAAIQMQNGYLEVQRGEFHSYFGVDKTACINAQGGMISVANGNFSSRIPNAEFTATATSNKVTVKEDDEKAYEESYFNVFNWQSESSYAKSGESYCILNGGTAKVTIGKGEFYASNNNVICMLGGTLKIGGGNFTKKLTVDPITQTEEADKKNVKYTALYMEDGSLNVSNVTVNVHGDYTAGVCMKNMEHSTEANLTVSNSQFNIEGDWSYGIYNRIHEETMETHPESFVVTDTSINMSSGDENKGITGIYSEGGMLQISSTRNDFIKISADNSTGIYVNGGEVRSSGYSYKLTGDNSAGIYSLGGTVEVVGGNIDLESIKTCYGVYVNTDSSQSSNHITLVNAHINVGYDNATTTSKSGTVAACVGVCFAANNKGVNKLQITDSDILCYEVGIAMRGGTIEFVDVDGEINEIKTQKASAIAMLGGALVFNGDYQIVSNNTVSSSSKNSYEITLPFENDGSPVVSYRNTDGIYVENGNITANGKITLDHNGLQNATDIENYNYSSLKVTSYAVRVVGGSVNLQKADITALSGGGIYCSKESDAQESKIIMGSENSELGDISVKTMGVLMGDTYNSVVDYASEGWQSKKSITGGHAIELNGGNITVYNGTFEAQFGNGVAANGSGTINIYGGNFYGWMSTLSGKSGPAAYYGLKVIGGATVNIYGGTFDGGNGGAFVTGIDEFTYNSKLNYTINSSGGKYANVFVYKGTFGSENTVDAFNVYDYANVVFGAYGTNNGNLTSATDYESAIKMNGSSATIAANQLAYNTTTRKTSVINVYYGTYKKGDKGIWNDGIATITIYNSNFGYTTYSNIGSVVDANNTTVKLYSE